MTSDATIMSAKRNLAQTKIFTARLLIGALQGIAFYLLVETARNPRVWPATEPVLYVPLYLLVAFVPLLALFGVTQLRIRHLIFWLLAASLAVIALGIHDALRGRADPYVVIQTIGPWYKLSFVLTIGLFIAHVLVIDSAAERRWIPTYDRHVDTAWKMGAQVALAFLFVVMFWGVLYLSSNLFLLLHLDFMQRLIRQPAFYYPATTVALAVSIHITDVQVALLRGTRSLMLTLLSWLLPLLTILVLGFLCSLLVVRLETLWSTRFATRLLLVASALLIFLINASYQEASGFSRLSRVKYLSVVLGATELLPLAFLSAWGIGLRVVQHGWTTERIFAAALVLLAFCYAVGYAWALPTIDSSLKRFEMANVAAAYLVLALILALFSPVADPARLMVADQIFRLKSGAVSADQFDFRALKFEGARWGHDALVALSQSKDTAQSDVISQRAKDALAMGFQVPGRSQPITVTDYAAHVTVYPPGQTLPPDFFDSVKGPFSEPKNLPACLRFNTGRCEARLVPLRQGAPDAILFFDSYTASVYERGAEGHWQKTGTIFGPINCKTVRDGFAKGALRLEPHRTEDIVIGDQTLTVLPFPRGTCYSVPPPRGGS